MQGELLLWIQLEHQLQLHFQQSNATADGASAGPGSDPNNKSTVGTTFEILFIDEFTGSISTDGTDKFVGSIMVGVDDGAKKAFVPAASNDVMNLNGEAGAGNATKGGLIGSRYCKVYSNN